MLSQTVEYALRTAVDLAARGGVPATVEEMAGRTRVPRSYLARVLQGLTRAGLVESRRGVGGGRTLARPATGITVLDVVGAVEPVRRIATCPLGLPPHGPRLCPLHKRPENALAALEAAFAGTTLAELADELADEPAGGGPLRDVTGPGRRRVPLPAKAR